MNDSNFGRECVVPGPIDDVILHHPMADVGPPLCHQTDHAGMTAWPASRCVIEDAVERFTGLADLVKRSLST